MTMTSENQGESREGLSQDAETQWKIGLGLAELVGGILFAAIAGYFLISAQDLPTFKFNPADPGVAAFPNTMGLVLLGCSLALAAIGIVRMRRNGAADEKVVIVQPLNVIAAIVLTVIYALVMPYVTYYVATAVWVPLLLLLSSIRSWKSIAILTASLMIFAYLVFELLLNVKLP
ncbi:MAG: tripartite tricarboxylate transporter TctB family protein [Rhodospirillales bacterium]